jgi:hypothetical protein
MIRKSPSRRYLLVIIALNTTLKNPQELCAEKVNRPPPGDISLLRHRQTTFSARFVPERASKFAHSRMERLWCYWNLLGISSGETPIGGRVSWDDWDAGTRLSRVGKATSKLPIKQVVLGLGTGFEQSMTVRRVTVWQLNGPRNVHH